MHVSVCASVYLFFVCLFVVLGGRREDTREIQYHHLEIRTN